MKTFFHLFRAICVQSQHMKCVLLLWVEVKFEEHSSWCDPPTLRWGGMGAVVWWFTRLIVSKYCDIKDGSPPGSSVHGISQARTLERVAISFSKESSLPRDWTQVSYIAGGVFTDWAISRGVNAEDWLTNPSVCHSTGCWVVAVLPLSHQPSG